MVRDGFRKVRQEGGTFVVATFFNPVTGETYEKCVRDYDYGDCSRDDDDAYYMEIDPVARRAWLRSCGVVSPGDVVRVVKGRKVPVGTVGTVARMFDWKDRYGRVQTRYCVLTDGTKVSVDNVILEGGAE